MILSLVRAGAAALALAVFASPGDAQTPNVKFTLDFAIQGQQSPFVLAAEGGHFARAGVNVQVDRGYGSADAITKVASGAYDMAFADIGALIQFNGRQAGARKVAAFGRQHERRLLALNREVERELDVRCLCVAGRSKDGESQGSGTRSNQ